MIVITTPEKFAASVTLNAYITKPNTLSYPVGHGHKEIVSIKQNVLECGSTVVIVECKA